MLFVLGLVVCQFGLAACIYGLAQNAKVARVGEAPLARTGDAAARGLLVAGPNGALSAEGDVLCPRPLVAPVSGKPCLYYEITCTARWKEGEAEQVREIASEKDAADFSLDDGSGPVRVEAGRGGSFEPLRKRVETKGPGLVGGITGAELAFGRYRVATRALSPGATYTVVETFLPVQPRLYVCGKATAYGAIVSPDWRRLLISSKSRDELLDGALVGGRRFLTAGGVAFAVGALLALLGR